MCLRLLNIYRTHDPLQFLNQIDAAEKNETEEQSLRFISKQPRIDYIVLRLHFYSLGIQEELVASHYAALSALLVYG